MDAARLMIEPCKQKDLIEDARVKACGRLLICPNEARSILECVVKGLFIDRLYSSSLTRVLKYQNPSSDTVESFYPYNLNLLITTIVMKLEKSLKTATLLERICGEKRNIKCGLKTFERVEIGIRGV
jgi:hypothetical protein